MPLYPALKVHQPLFSKFIDLNNILYDKQFGFCKVHSAQLALILLNDKITHTLDRGESYIGVFLDCQNIVKLSLQWSHKQIAQNIKNTESKGNQYITNSTYTCISIIIITSLLVLMECSKLIAHMTTTILGTETDQVDGNWVFCSNRFSVYPILSMFIQYLHCAMLSVYCRPLVSSSGEPQHVLA